MSTPTRVLKSEMNERNVGKQRTMDDDVILLSKTSRNGSSQCYAARGEDVDIPYNTLSRSITKNVSRM